MVRKAIGMTLAVLATIYLSMFVDTNGIFGFIEAYMGGHAAEYAAYRDEPIHAMMSRTKERAR